MTYPPKQTFTFPQNGLNLAQPRTRYPVVFGCSSLGTPTEWTKFTKSGDAIAALGYGPGVDLAAILADQGGCWYVECTASTAGAAGSVTASPVGSGTGTVTVAGTSTNSYEVAIEIMATGTLGTGRFRYRLDYNSAVPAQSTLGSGWSPELTIPSGGTYLMAGTGLTLTFVPGAGPTFFEVGDLHTFDATGPQYAAADLAAAVATLDTYIGNEYFDMVFLTGVNDTGSDAATMAAALDTALTTFAGYFYFCRAILDMGSPEAAATAKSGFASFSSADGRIVPAWGYCYTATKVPQVGRNTPKLPLVVNAAERANSFANSDPSQNLGRFLSGSLRGVSYITHDEDRSQAFIEEDKILTTRTFRGAAGYYITNGYLRSAAGSDYLYWDYGVVADIAARVVFLAQRKWTLAKLRAKTDGTGQLTELSALRVEDDVKAQLFAALMEPFNVEGERGYVSGVGYTVDRTNNALSTRLLYTTVAMVPFIVIEGMNTSIGFATEL